MPLRLDVVTIEREVYSADDVDIVVVPSTEGLMGILPRHAPVVTALKEGTLEIVRGEDREELAIGGGFVEVVADRVIVMADVAEQADEIDIDRAEKARERAAATLASAPEKARADGRSCRSSAGGGSVAGCAEEARSRVLG